jgi:hypothetical protein
MHPKPIAARQKPRRNRFQVNQASAYEGGFALFMMSWFPLTRAASG